MVPTGWVGEQDYRDRHAAVEQFGSSSAYNPKVAGSILPLPLNEKPSTEALPDRRGPLAFQPISPISSYLLDATVWSETPREGLVSPTAPSQRRPLSAGLAVDPTFGFSPRYRDPSAGPTGMLGTALDPLGTSFVEYDSIGTVPARRGIQKKGNIHTPSSAPTRHRVALTRVPWGRGAATPEKVPAMRSSARGEPPDR